MLRKQRAYPSRLFRRVLNGKVDVALETQTKVQEVIAQLGYTSNLAARSMRGGKMNLIGLIMPDIGFPFSAEVMKGVNRAIAESEFDLLLYTTGDVRKHETAAHQQRYVSLLNNSITDGVLIVATVAADFTSDAPLVSIDSAVVNPSYPSIHATNYKGALDAMNYLLGLGHTRIGFIGGRPELESAVRRKKGYRDALVQAGIPVDASAHRGRGLHRRAGSDRSSPIHGAGRSADGDLRCQRSVCHRCDPGCERVGIAHPGRLVGRWL